MLQCLILGLTKAYNPSALIFNPLLSEHPKASYITLTLQVMFGFKTPAMFAPMIMTISISASLEYLCRLSLCMETYTFFVGDDCWTVCGT